MTMNRKALIVILQIVSISSGNGGLLTSSSHDILRDVDHPFLVMLKRYSSRGSDFSDSEAKAIVDRHNFHRSNPRESAANMRLMEWNTHLATVAQQWADKCVYKHGGFKSTDFDGGVGQNIGVGGSGHPNSKSGVYFTDQWHAEEKFYTYETSACVQGEMCGHYTQAIWAESYAIGCGRKRCANIQVGGRVWRDTYYIVCNYGPAGNKQNWVNGKLVKDKPFKLGESCTDCPVEAPFCSKDRLCRDCSNAMDKAACSVCKRKCDNCGVLDWATCTCTCKPGWEGTTCSNVCADRDGRCGNPRNGWPDDKFCYNHYEGRWMHRQWEFGEMVRQNCPKMCALCQPQDPPLPCRG